MKVAWASSTARNLVGAGPDAVVDKLDAATGRDTTPRQPAATTPRATRRTPGNAIPEPRI